MLCKCFTPVRMERMNCHCCRWTPATRTSAARQANSQSSEGKAINRGRRNHHLLHQYHHHHQHHHCHLYNKGDRMLKPKSSQTWSFPSSKYIYIYGTCRINVVYFNMSIPAWTRAARPNKRRANRQHRPKVGHNHNLIQNGWPRWQCFGMYTQN